MEEDKGLRPTKYICPPSTVKLETRGDDQRWQVLPWLLRIEDFSLIRAGGRKRIRSRFSFASAIRSRTFICRIFFKTNWRESFPTNSPPQTATPGSSTSITTRTKRGSPSANFFLRCWQK